MKNSKGIVMVGDDEITRVRARANGLPAMISSTPIAPFDKTLIVEAGTRVPFDLLLAAWNFLDHWDAAVPIWRSGVLARDVGSPEDQARTTAAIGETRVPLHSYELLFVRGDGAGKALVDSWVSEMEDGGDKRLAFLRAFHFVKPRMCVLPVTWLAEVRDYETPRSSRAQLRAPSRPLVTVEVSPGRFVKAYQGDEEKVRASFLATQGTRGNR